MSLPICIVFYDWLQLEYNTSNVRVRSHCEYYPHNRTVPKGVFGDLRGMLDYFKTGTFLDLWNSHAVFLPNQPDTMHYRFFLESVRPR
jgi:hypothetical protein